MLSAVGFCLLAAASAPSVEVRDVGQSRAAVQAIEYLRARADALALEPADLDDVVVTSETTNERTGVTHVYLRQRYRGVEISGADLTVNVSRDGHVLNHVGQFVASVRSAVNQPASTLTAAQAVSAAARHLGVRLSRHERTSIPAKRIYHPAGRRDLRLAWEVEIKTRDGQHWWVATVDAATGALLDKSDRVVSSKEAVA
jgi:extracellular elastinolytic metalloproteinase